MKFQDVIAKNDFLVLDTETTGLYRGQAEICQIAIINQSGDVMLDTLVKPVKRIPADAIRIHGITNEQVADAPTWADVAPKVMDLIFERDVVIYNAGYDTEMLLSASEIAQVQFRDDYCAYCAMLAYAEFLGDWDDYHGNYRWQKLSTAASIEKVKVVNAHSALGDCLMTLGVIRSMERKGWKRG